MIKNKKITSLTLLLLIISATTTQSSYLETTATVATTIASTVVAAIKSTGNGIKAGVDNAAYYINTDRYQEIIDLRYDSRYEQKRADNEAERAKKATEKLRKVKKELKELRELRAQEESQDREAPRTKIGRLRRE